MFSDLRNVVCFSNVGFGMFVSKGKWDGGSSVLSYPDRPLASDLPGTFA